MVSTKLIIRWEPGKLSEDVNLMLCFQPPSASTLSSKQNMVAWKVITMKSKPGKAMNQAAITYTADLAFACNTVDSGNIVGVSSVIECDINESVSLESKGDYPVWNDPIRGDHPKLLKAYNHTTTRQKMSIGTLKPEYTPTFMWNVGAGNSIEAEFHPILMGFVNLGYKESEFITADITSAVMWTQDLARLPSQTTWEFKEGSQGSFSLTELNI